jgi:DNA-binding NtrC family response regulator
MPTPITQEAMDVLLTHDWPGNVRELENIILRAVVLSRGNVITPEQIVFQNELNRYVLDVEQKVRAGTPLDVMLREVKREAIVTALRLNDHDFTRAAAMLDLSDEDLRSSLAELKLMGEVDEVSIHEYAPRGSRDGQH